MGLISEERLRWFHTNHRTPFQLEYIDHKVKLDHRCRYCYNKVCTCAPRWILQMKFYCSWCDKICTPRTWISADQVTPSLEDFFQEEELEQST